MKNQKLLLVNKKFFRKKRIDQILLEKGIVESRNKAQALIMAGQIYSNNKLVKKSGEFFKDDAYIEVIKKNNNWVSRGALKIEPIILSQKVEVKDKICLDIGSSTGGFSEILLKYGAKKIYAVDVGYGQLHEKIRSNNKVISIERKNARYLTYKEIDQDIDLLVCDASFISLKKVISRPLEFLKKNGKFIGLIKPQFEAKRKEVKRGGIIKDPLVRKRVCKEVKDWLTKEKKLKVLNIIECPIRYSKGNVEYFVIATSLT